MEIILIAAMSANRVIGRKGTIPWHIPEEQRFFRDTTWGFPLVMGRKTYDSIGRSLPGRRNIVISRQEGLLISGCEVTFSLAEAIKLCGVVEKIFIVGGAQIFVEAMPLADTIILSTLQREIDGDVFFPEIPPEFHLLSSINKSGTTTIECRSEDSYIVEIYRL